MWAGCSTSLAVGRVGARRTLLEVARLEHSRRPRRGLGRSQPGHRAYTEAARLRPLVVGLSLFLGFSGGSWATMHWLWRSIEIRIEALATLNRQVEQARWTLAEIEETTWGATLPGHRGRAVRGAAVRYAGQSALDRAAVGLP